MINARALAVLTLTFAAAQAGCNAVASAVEREDRTRPALALDGRNPRLNYIKLETVSESDATASVQLTGRVAFDENHTQRLSSPVDGRVTRVVAQLGDAVKKGQAVLELSSPRVADIQADVKKSQEDLVIAAKSFSRANRLKGEGAISDKEVAQIEADFAKATADDARASSQWRSLSLSPMGPSVGASLVAQVTGTVVERNVSVGQEVRADAAAPLLTIADLGTVWVLADVYEEDLSVVRQGARVVVRVSAYPGESFAGTIDHVGDVLDPATHTVKLRCVVPNGDHRLKPEMFAKIQLMEAAEKRAIFLPSKAILTDADHARVLVASEGNAFRPRDVDVGPEVDGRVRVLRGLSPGDKVVTDGAIFLRRQMQSD
jgi:cobalt-zinc-cadmium efflux system membrane fusion protein